MIKALQLHQQVPISDGSLHILKGVSLEIEAGETVAIVGASGSGKSTLLGMLAGLDIPSAGKVYLNQHEITQLDEEARAQVRSQLVSFVFQNFQLLGSLNALENVMLPLELRGEDNPEDKAKHYLNRVGLEQRIDHYPNQLSGGEQQRVALARAFACEAPIIFADEPTGNLDTQTGEKVAQLLFDLNKETGTTLVLVTHSQALAEKCDRQLEMRSGELLEAV
ncbi:ABC transporter ATP-binding protein [Agarilytica rhodophyticola]|uniref:ABC transporter ATP-binding protein n=1 Tax=Agarilytica rhodophyticola TaxID=1737490 RepID=UPI000B347350|nr:ABC transporter ATP-binding protein [Agarilytica rhodophyticola]